MSAPLVNPAPIIEARPLRVFDNTADPAADPTVQPSLAQAHSLLSTGEVDASLDRFRALIASGTDVAFAYRGAGAICFLRKDYREAGRLLDASLKANPSDPTALYLRGQVAAAIGDMAEARTFYQRAVATDPEHEGAQSALQQQREPRPSDEVGAGRARGTVAGMQQRAGTVRKTGIIPRGATPVLSLYTWAFRLERRDASGAALPAITVAMTGTRFVGIINNGDVIELELPRNWRNGTILTVSSVRNLTGNITVEAHGWTPARRVARGVGRLVSTLVLLALIAGLIGFLLIFAHSASQSRDTAPATIEATSAWQVATHARSDSHDLAVLAASGRKSLSEYRTIIST